MPRQPWVVAIENNAICGTHGNGVKQLRRVVDLAKAIELVAQDVEQQAIAWGNLLDEVHRMRFVKLEHGNIRWQYAVGINRLK